MDYNVSFYIKVGSGKDDVVEVEQKVEAFNESMAIAIATAQYYEEAMAAQSVGHHPYDLTEIFEVLVYEDDTARSEQLRRDHADGLGNL